MYYSYTIYRRGAVEMDIQIDFTTQIKFDTALGTNVLKLCIESNIDKVFPNGFAIATVHGGLQICRADNIRYLPSTKDFIFISNNMTCTFITSHNKDALKKIEHNWCQILDYTNSVIGSYVSKQC